MPDAVAGKARAKSRLYWWRFRPDARSRRERGPHIDRHPMGRCRCFLSQIVDGHTDYDTRRCGGPIGAIRGSQGLSSVIFHGFCPFSLRDAAHRCRVFCRVSIGYYGLSLSVSLLHAVARASSYGLKTLKNCSSPSSKLLARPLGVAASGCKALACSPKFSLCTSLLRGSGRMH